MTNEKLLQIEEVLARGVEKIYPNKDALEKTLKSKKKLRVYCGYDPTSSTLHLGHAITLRKLSQFQNLGHEVIFLIGDFTARIGDPTDKSATRPKLSKAEIKNNLKLYKEQASKIIAFSGKNPAKVMFNSKWSNQLTFEDIIELASCFTVQQMIIRDMFQERIKKSRPIYLHEFLYPLAQGYDSLAMGVDVEVGGNDQTFNMLCGRALLKEVKQKEKFVLTTRLLVDDSGKKMSKTEGNIVALSDSPGEMFGKIMSWHDSLILPAFELCTSMPQKDIKAIENDIEAGQISVMDAKSVLAKNIVSIHRGKLAAKKAAEEFKSVFREKNMPTNMPEFKIIKSKVPLLELLVALRLVNSKSEAKRLILQGGVKIDGVLQKDWQKTVEIKKGHIVQVGKRKFAKIT